MNWVTLRALKLNCAVRKYILEHKIIYTPFLSIKRNLTIIKRVGSQRQTKGRRILIIYAEPVILNPKSYSLSKFDLSRFYLGPKTAEARKEIEGSCFP